MSVHVMSLVWDWRAKNHTQKLILLALADNANESGACWPSITHLVKKCDVCRQTALRNIEELKTDGVLEICHTKGKVNHYRILTAKLTEPSPHDQSRRVTSPGDGLVQESDHHQSRRVTTPVYGVDSNHQEPSKNHQGDFPLIPDSLDREPFPSTWSEWMGERKRIKKPISALAAKKQFKILEPLGPVAAAACLDDSIRNGWTGIFPQRGSQKTKDELNQRLNDLLYERECIQGRMEEVPEELQAEIAELCRLTGRK